MNETPLFSFVHCSDLHLDSPFEGVHAVAPEIAAVLRDATFKAFNNVIDLAVQQGADFLIVAGDVYDGADRSLRAQLRFRDALQRAVDAGMECFVAHGNHDPLSGWEAGVKMPDGVHRFGGEGVEGVIVRRGSEELAHIYGISYSVREVGENLVKRFHRESNTPFAIGVLHCNVGGDPNHDNYAPCTIDDLVNTGMDYWALGHIHAQKVLRESEPCIVYSGNTQGRTVREAGARGCYLVQVDAAGQVTPQFVPTDVVRWFAEEVDIAELETMDDLLERLESKREDIRARAEGRGAVLRLRLIGRGDLHGKLRRMGDLALPLREGETERPDDFVWVESVQVATRPTIDIEKRRAIEDFVGDFLRVAEKLRTQQNASETMRELLTNRPEHRVIAEQIEHLRETDLSPILDEAEALGLDQLLREEE